MNNKTQWGKFTLEVTDKLELVIDPWDSGIYSLDKHQVECLLDAIDEALFVFPKKFEYEFEDDMNKSRTMSIYNDCFWWDSERVSKDLILKLHQFLEKHYAYYIYRNEDFYSGYVHGEEDL